MVNLPPTKMVMTGELFIIVSLTVVQIKSLTIHILLSTYTDAN